MLRLAYVRTLSCRWLAYHCFRYPLALPFSCLCCSAFSFYLTLFYFYVMFYYSLFFHLSFLFVRVGKCKPTTYNLVCLLPLLDAYLLDSYWYSPLILDTYWHSNFNSYKYLSHARQSLTYINRPTADYLPPASCSPFSLTVPPLYFFWINRMLSHYTSV